MKILGFDSWTGGQKFYQQLVEPLNKLSCDLMLLHLGSWGVDKGHPVEETVGGLLMRDIAWYKGKSFLQIIDHEKPDAVLFLSTNTFAHRTFNRLCKYRSIPTILQYHGLMRALAEESGSPYKINLASQFIFIFTRLFKMLTKTWPVYLSAMLKTNAGFINWYEFFRDNICFAFGKRADTYAHDAKPDLCCVYTEAEVEHAVSRYNLEKTSVIPVGNPDLTSFGFSDTLFGKCLIDYTSRIAFSDVLYIDTALIHRGSVFIDASDFLSHLIYTRKKLNEQNKNMLIKLHPHHFRTDLPAVLENNGIKVCQNKEYIEALNQCCAVIVEPSSAAIVPALMGLPVFLAKFCKLEQQQYGKLLTSYPRSNYLTDINELTTRLKSDTENLDLNACRLWISENAGPLPSELMPERVANIIRDYINTFSLS